MINKIKTLLTIIAITAICAIAYQMLSSCSVLPKQQQSEPKAICNC